MVVLLYFYIMQSVNVNPGLYFLSGAHYISKCKDVCAS